MTASMGEIRVPAYLLEFDSGDGRGFPLVEVEDILGTVHRGRFVGRKTGSEGLRVALATAADEHRWVRCDPNRQVTIFPGR